MNINEVNIPWTLTWFFSELRNTSHMTPLKRLYKGAQSAIELTSAQEKIW